MYFYYADTIKTIREIGQFNEKIDSIDKEVVQIYYCIRYKVIHIKCEI